MFGLSSTSFGTGFAAGIQGVSRSTNSMFSSFPNTLFGGIMGNFFGGLGGAGSMKFPPDLEDRFYVVIRVFDNMLSSYKGFALSNNIVGMAAGIDSSVQNAFGDVKAADEAFGGEVGSKLPTESIEGIASNVTNQTFEGGFFSQFFSSYSGYLDMIRTQLGGFGFGNAKLPRIWKYNIYLPIPNTLTESYSHNYNEERGWLHNAGTPARMFEAVLTRLGNFSANVAKLTGGQYVRYNQNKIMMYDSTNFRSISLHWKLIPNSPEEAQSIMELIRLLKMFSSAGTTAGKLFLTSPYYFSLEFRNKVLNDSLRFDEVVLTNIEVSYSPSGNLNVHKDDMPKAIDLTVTFKDREPKVREDWASRGNYGQLMPEGSCDNVTGDDRGSQKQTGDSKGE